VLDETIIRRAVELAATDPEFRRHAEHWTGVVQLGTESQAWRLEVTAAAVSGPTPVSAIVPVTDGDVAVLGPDELWRKVLAAVPPPTCTTMFSAALLGMDVRIGGMDGARYLAVNRLSELLRHAANGSDPAPQAMATTARHGDIDAAVGRYVHLVIDGVDYRVYYEEAGTGIGLLCQHTAGADARQWRHLLEDQRITSQYRVIAYDLPFHGKSLPPVGKAWWTEQYMLTKDFATAVVRGLAKVLELDRPAFIGSSLGGMLALDLAHDHPDDFRAAISCEGALKFDVGRWFASLAPNAGEVMSLGFQPDVALHAATQTPYMGATAPVPYQKETWWGYAQGGPGVFPGDIHYYSDDHDLNGRGAEFDTSRCAVHLLTGEYDYPSLVISREAAEQIPGATYRQMAGLGHFPMSEDPERFATYLLPILEEIAKEEPR